MFSPFAKKSVDHVVADINKWIKDLRLVGEYHSAKLALHQGVADLRTRAAKVASDESDRAHRLANKFEELIK